MFKCVLGVFVAFANPAFAGDDLPILGNDGQKPIFASEIAYDDTITGSIQLKKTNCTILNCLFEENVAQKVEQSKSSP